MKIKKILSVILSCSVVGFSAASPSAMAYGYDTYNSIKSSESKDLIKPDVPFQVFDIYNAYYGITTTTTTRPTTTTKSTTKLTTTTTKSTTKTTATTKSTTKTTTTTKSTTKTTTTTKAATTKSTTKTTSTTTKPTTSTSKTTSSGTTTSTTTAVSADTTSTTTETSSTAPFYRGIDVSQYQYEVDWQKVAESGEVDFAIVRAGYGKEIWQEDPYFDRNMQGADAAGIDTGIYWYSYAETVEDARKEAETCYQIIKEYSFEYPVYFDIEEPRMQNNHTTAEVSAIIDAFCTELENKGYYVGVYSYANFLQTSVYDEILNKYDVWVAQYSSSPYAYSGKYGMWQYSSSGTIDGIPTNVDMNYCYKNYNEIIGENPDPNFVPPPVVTTAVCEIVEADREVIDWGNISESSFTMLAVNFSDDEEPDEAVFADNVAGAKEAERKIGIMWQADALTTEEMIADAEKFHVLIENYQVEYPVYLDLTDSVITESELTPDEISELIKAFCSVFDSDKKHYIGVRGFDGFLSERVNADIFEAYDVWLIAESDDIKFTNKYGIISMPRTDEDGNTYYETLCNRNYPSVMAAYHLNGF